ncbi:hypothetical protein [Nitrosopumilus sp.]|uniref:hypothetical protein n=1 Tax=Nitrosopumilus sp. TaxID=2024843 RepID=UPI00292E4BAD|nr:hypothetical protein [Nitrosopumilus sp.]
MITDKKEEASPVREKKFSFFDDSDLEVTTKPFCDEANEAAARIAKYGRPIIQIEKYLNSKIKDDPILVKQLLRVFLSAYTNEPINVGVLAPSSEGKTYATVEISEIFPEKDIISIGRLSPTALIHSHGRLVDSDGEPLESRLQKIREQMAEAENEGDRKTARELKGIMADMIASARNEVDLTHKILLFLDNPKPETYEMLKPILSHDKKEILYKTTKSDGSLSVKDTIIKGWPAVIVCSAKNEAKNEVWEEIATRFFIVSPNTNISKYYEANKLTSQKIGKPSWASGVYANPKDKRFCRYYIYRLRDSLTELCQNGENPVFNPFADKLAELFPHNQGVTMRHFKRLMSFCNIESLINANSLMKLEFVPYHGNKKISVITSLETIQNAIKIIGKVSTVPPEKIKFYEKVFVPAIQDKMMVQTSLDENNDQQQIRLDKYQNNNNSNVSLTSSECAEWHIRIFAKPITSKQVLENYLKPLIDEGLLESSYNPDNKSQKLYHTSSQLTIHNLEGFIRRLVETIETSFLYIWSCLAQMGQASIEIGKITRIYDNDNTHIPYLEFKKKISGSVLNSVETYSEKRRSK